MGNKITFHNWEKKLERQELFNVDDREKTILIQQYTTRI